MKKNITGILIILLIVAAVFAVKKCSSSENISSDLLSFDLNVTEIVDFNKLTSQGLPVIVDYGADTCIPCVNMAPVLEKLNKEMAGRVYIKFADVWKYPDINKKIKTFMLKLYLIKYFLIKTANLMSQVRKYYLMLILLQKQKMESIHLLCI